MHSNVKGMTTCRCLSLYFFLVVFAVFFLFWWIIKALFLGLIFHNQLIKKYEDGGRKHWKKSVHVTASTIFCLPWWASFIKRAVITLLQKWSFKLHSNARGMISCGWLSFLLSLLFFSIFFFRSLFLFSFCFVLFFFSLDH